MTRLFIENQEVEMDKSVQFAITKQFEDLSNPTTIINDWSKTVSIPFTQKNNNLFGNIYKADRLIVTDGTDKNTGIYFNQLLKMDFRLQDGDNVIMTGYAKMNEIKQKDGKGTYEITLFGELGKVLSEMQKYTFDEDDTDYCIDTTDYNFVLTRNTISNKITSPEPSVKGIYYTLNNGFVEGFDYKTTQTDGNTTTQFKDILNSESIQFEARTNISIDSIIGNGLKPLDVGEFRSWCQTPYLYVQQLFDLVDEKLQSRIGYSFQKDSSWFNTSNSYWNDIVMILNHQTVEGKLSYQNRYIAKHNEYKNGNFPYNFTRNNSDSDEQYNSVYKDIVRFEVDASKSGYEQLPVVDNDFAIITQLNNYDYVVSGLKLLMYNNSKNSGKSISDDATLKIHIKLRNKRFDTYWEDDYYVVNDSGNYQNLYPSRNYIVIPKTVDTTTEYIDGNTLYMHFWEIPLPNIYLNNYYGSNSIIEIIYNFEGSHYIFDGTKQPSVYCILGRKSVNIFATETYINIKPTIKSYTTITLPMLWDNNVKPFDIILNYCKMFGIMIEVDDVNKKVVLKQRKQYFSNHTIEDWTNKVDYSKDYIVVPVVANSKYLLFNYDDIKTSLSDTYSKSVGFNIGEKQLSTGYNFDNSTTKLFSKLKNSNSYTPNMLEYDKLKQLTISYIGTQFIMIDDIDKDNKHLSTFGSFYMLSQDKFFPGVNSSNVVFITDDSVYEKANDRYCYGAEDKITLDSSLSNKNTSINVLGFRQLSILKDNKICLFNKPATSFIMGTDFTNTTDIYTQYWKNYLDERYNIQNKKVTCYVKLTPLDWVNFKFNKFVKINNQLYIVNKIYDYDISSNQPTKVDLITIQDVTGYTN